MDREEIKTAVDNASAILNGVLEYYDDETEISAIRFVLKETLARLMKKLGLLTEDNRVYCNELANLVAKAHYTKGYESYPTTDWREVDILIDKIAKLKNQ